MCIVRSRGGEFSWEVSLYVRLTEADESKHCTTPAQPPARRRRTSHKKKKKRTTRILIVTIKQPQQYMIIYH